MSSGGCVIEGIFNHHHHQIAAVCVHACARACARHASVRAVCLHNRVKVSAKSPGKFDEQIDPKVGFSIDQNVVTFEF